MIAEVAQPDVRYVVVLDNASSCVGQHDLSTVRSTADPSRAAHSHAHIAVGVKVRLRSVQADSHAHCVRGNERTLGGDGRRHGIPRALENDEEAVPFGIDFLSAMCPEYFAEDAAVLRAEVTERGAVPTRKVGRALDVAEEERHGSARQTSIHTARWYAEREFRHSERGVSTGRSAGRACSRLAGSREPRYSLNP